MSNTSFKYTDLKISPKTNKTQGEINVSFKLKNTGNYDGDEVVQLYIRDKYSRVITYDSQLRGFERISLDKGETKEINFKITPQDLEYLDENMNWTVESGEFEVLIGSSSEDICLQGIFELN